MNPLRKGVHMLTGILRPRHSAQVPVVTGPLPITPEWQRRRICEEQAERQRRLDALIAETSVFRQENHDHH